ncbi:alpha/beta fold hydrolase [Bradyrhizobium sp. CSA207]|nr:alpha/beta fold hydrolase [Bradyrhizobium sp. CSA207]
MLVGAVQSTVCTDRLSPTRMELAMGNTKPRTVILVHGAWTDGSCWSSVIAQLNGAAVETTAVQLPLSSLAEDVATVQRAMALEEGPLLLVGHSYGGVVITQAGDDPKIAGLVYVAAFAPDADQSALSLAELLPPSPAASELERDGSGFFKLTRKGILEDFAQDLIIGQKEVMIATQGPISIHALGAPVSSTAWRGRSCWYVLAENDRTIWPALQERMSSHIGAETIRVPAGHVAMLSCPQKVAEVILLATAATLSRKRCEHMPSKGSRP